MDKPIADVFTWPSDDPSLIGSRCSECSAVTFPAQSRCPRCGRTSMQEELLPRRGRLVSWTTQGFAPVVPYAGDPLAAGVKDESDSWRTPPVTHQGTADLARPSNLFLVHGEVDEVVAVDATRWAAQGLSAAGFEVEARIERGLGHGIGPYGLRAGAGFLAKYLIPDDQPPVTVE